MTTTDTATIVYLATNAREGGTMLHRATCKRALANPDHWETPHVMPGAKAATCCKPVVPGATPKVRSIAEARSNRHAAKAADVKASADKIGEAQDQFVETMHAAIAKVTSPDRPKRVERSPEYVKAAELKKAGKRGKGKSLTDAELDAYIRKADEARPAAFSAEQLEIAYWVDAIALSRSRWNAAWARVFGGEG